MKRLIFTLALGWACLGVRADDSPAPVPGPKDLANQVITAFRSGKRDWIAQNSATTVPVLEKAAADSPDGMIFYALGICDLQQGNKQATVRDLARAYELSPQDIGIDMLYSLVLKMNKEPLKAYEVDKKAAALNLEIPQLQIQFATLAMSIQKYDEAAAVLTQLWKNAPANLQPQDRAMLRYMLGTCYLYQGQHQQAIGMLTDAVSDNPKLLPALVALGEAYLKTGDNDKAAANLDRALAINPKYYLTLYYKGLCLEKTGQADAARQSFQSAYNDVVRRLQDNGQDYFIASLISAKLGRWDESKNWQQQAANLLFTHDAPWATK